MSTAAAHGPDPTPPGTDSGEVVLLRWPAEAALRDALHLSGTPRVLLLEGDEPPPDAIDAEEDWIRLPASDADVAARVAGLARRSVLAARPTLDDDDVLHADGAALALPPIEARLTRALLERPGAVVNRDVLVRAAWPASVPGRNPPGRNALDVHLLRLRRRLAPVGLAIHTVRGRGYRLERTGHPV